MTAPKFQFQKATRSAVKLKIAIDGASGSGKTFGALMLAAGITNGGRVALADSENGSASYYADRFAFDSIDIPNAEPATYGAIIDAAVAGGYDVLVIDSLSHAWQTILNGKDDYDRAHPKTNPWANWRLFSPRWEGLVQHILHAPLHVIATMRSKQAYEQIEKAGKKEVVKLGLQPQVREGSEYEFGLVFSVEQSHLAKATKDRTMLFGEREVDLADPALHSELIAWMNTGGERAPTSAAPGAPAARPQLHRDERPAGSSPALSEVQKAKIFALLARSDLDLADAAKEKYRAMLSADTALTARRADEIIAGLEKLVPAAPRASTPPAIAADGTIAPPGKVSDALEPKPGAVAPATTTEDPVASLAARIKKTLKESLLETGERKAFYDRLADAKDTPTLLNLLGDVDAAIDGLPF